MKKIAALIGARLFGREDNSICRLLTDSRSLSFPEETLFFAIHTKRNDGHRYIPELYSRGVRSFVIEDLPEDYAARFPEATFLQVTDTLQALQRLAERHRDEFQIPVIAITGSNGKTIVKEWLHQILTETFGGRVIRSPRSYNSQIGVPLSVWRMDRETKLAIFEAGISQPGEMQRLRNIIQPTIGILTNIGDAHQENFESLEQKCLEKLQLFTEAELLICPDTPLVNECIKKLKLKAKIVHFCTTQDNDLNALLFTTLSQLAVSEEAIRESMKRLEPVAMRMELKEGQRGLTLINDSYNSDIASLDIALDFMARQNSGLPETLIISDILQTGIADEELYTQVASLAKARGVSRIIGIGEAISACRHCFSAECRVQSAELGCALASGTNELCTKENSALCTKENSALCTLHSALSTEFFRTTEEFLDSRLLASLSDSVVLIKGARRFRFDRISDALELKVHETILEVDLNALVANLNHYRSHLKEGTKLVAMVKADAYGAGAVEVAKALEDQRIDYLAVAVADEGAELRKAGIRADIMIMNPEMTAFKTMFDNKLEPEVYSFRLLDALLKAAKRHGITDYPIHIKLDTGMHRLGFDPERDIERLAAILSRQKYLTPRSVFSHFAGADEAVFDDFSAEQFRRFKYGADILQKAFGHKILRHIDNSAGILHFPERQMDMCRLGIGLYGVDNITNTLINNVSTLKTTILQIRDVLKEETVGYSRRGTLDRDSRIAAIPIGYADGLDRHLGNRRGCCIVNGQKAPFVGNICMDVTLIDVTGIPCQEGDSVEIFGAQMPVTDIADTLGTIPYEILTSISSRVKKVYFKD